MLGTSDNNLLTAAMSPTLLTLPFEIRSKIFKFAVPDTIVVCFAEHIHSRDQRVGNYCSA